MNVPTTEAVEPSVAAITAVPLNLADRCDRCGAQAFVRVSITSPQVGEVELLFCVHHFNQHETALRANPQVTAIQDEREKLNTKASQSSA